MSEAIAGVPRLTGGPSKPKDAAAVLLYRDGPSGRELFWLRRGSQVQFGGFFAFPGGKLDAQDLRVSVEGAVGVEAHLRAAAARELFEETGILMARGSERLSLEQRTLARRALLEAQLRFDDFLTTHGLSLAAQDFPAAGRWVTPPFLASRFDARFYLVHAPPDQDAEVWPGEHAEGGWVKPAEAKARWQAGTALLHPPNLHAIDVLGQSAPLAALLERLCHPPYAPGFIAQRLEFQQGIRLFPQETPTLPPATHTNSYVLGNGELLIVDPGASEVRQYARLLALVEGLKAEGKRPRAVLLTHHHEDHVGGALAVRERLKIPLWCHVRTAERLRVPTDRHLEDGEELVLSGIPTLRFRVLHTPGHARGHLCLYEPKSKALIAGDMVAGVGSIVVDPPEGDMTDYLAQLRRLRELPVGTLYPSHGPAIPEGTAKLDEYLRHREERERKVLSAMTPMGETLRELVAVAYADTPDFLHPLAERSAQAILIKLTREGRVVRKEDRYYPLGDTRAP